MEEMRNASKILVSKPEGRRPLRRPRLRQEDNIRMALWEMGWEVVGWIHMALDRDQCWAVMNTVMNLRVP
jgi:hypothetical protein